MLPPVDLLNQTLTVGADKTNGTIFTKNEILGDTLVTSWNPDFCNDRTYGSIVIAVLVLPPDDRLNQTLTVGADKTKGTIFTKNEILGDTLVTSRNPDFCNNQTYGSIVIAVLVLPPDDRLNQTLTVGDDKTKSSSFLPFWIAQSVSYKIGRTVNTSAQAEPTRHGFYNSAKVLPTLEPNF